jgi:hypothetical protein
MNLYSKPARKPRGLILTEEAHKVIDQELRKRWETSVTRQTDRTRKLTREAKADLLGLDEKTIDKLACRQPLSELVLQTIFDKLNIAPPFSKEQYCVSTAIYPEYEAVGGAVPLGSVFYVERHEDLEVHRAVAQRVSIVSIRGARQTGKSSLLARALENARRAGTTVLHTEWQSLRPEDLANSTAFYRAVALALADQLSLDIDPDTVLRPGRTPSHEFERFLRNHVFGTIDTPILWVIDDADRIFSCPFRDEVFALFRAWHNAHASGQPSAWRRFTLALAYTAEAHLAIRNLNLSPFDVGTRVILSDFTLSQLRELNTRHSGALSEVELGELFDLVGGHPYLVRRALLEITRGHVSLDQIVAMADQPGGIYADHLNRMLDILRTDAELSDDLRGILAGEKRSEESVSWLCAAGLLLVTDTAPGLRSRCPLYDRFLRRRIR